MIFISGNYTKTGFLDNSFDYAFAVESVVYALNKKDVVNEISRVLKPGGRFVIIDAFLTKDRPLNSFLQNAYMLDLQKRSIPGFISLREIRMHLESSGFSDISIHDLSKNVMVFYFFGGFLFSFKGVLSAEIKRLMNRWEKKSDEDADKMVSGAAFIEMLLGATKKIGYYAITATKK
jgi:SAM-dependent methyltransferase